MLINDLAASIDTYQLIIYVITLSLNCILAGIFVIIESNNLNISLNIHSSFDVVFEISYCIQNILYRTQNYEINEIILSFIPYVLLLNRVRSLLLNNLLLQVVRLHIYNYNDMMEDLDKISDTVVINVIRSQYKLNDNDTSDDEAQISIKKIRKNRLRLSLDGNITKNSLKNMKDEMKLGHNKSINEVKSINVANNNNNDKKSDELLKEMKTDEILKQSNKFELFYKLLKIIFGMLLTIVGIGLSSFTFTQINSQIDACTNKYGKCLWNGMQPKILFENGLFSSSTKSCGESMINTIDGMNCELTDDIFDHNNGPLYNPIVFKSVSEYILIILLYKIYEKLFIYIYIYI